MSQELDRGGTVNSFDETALPEKKPQLNERIEKPTRPLCAYNLFFRDQREKIIQDLPTKNQEQASRSISGTTTGTGRNKKKYHYKIGFADLAKTIAARWKTVDPAVKEKYEVEAAAGRTAYKENMEAWRSRQIALGLPVKQPRKKNVATSKKGGKTTGTARKPANVVRHIKPVPVTSQNVFDQKPISEGNSLNAAAPVPFIPSWGQPHFNLPPHNSFGDTNKVSGPLPEQDSLQSLVYNTASRDLQDFQNQWSDCMQSMGMRDPVEQQRNLAQTFSEYFPDQQQQHHPEQSLPTNGRGAVDSFRHHSHWQSLGPQQGDPHAVDSTNKLAQELGPDGVNFLVKAFRTD